MIVSKGIRQVPSNHPYITSFPKTEQPMCEGGIWVNGLQTGRDWSDVATNGTIAHCTQDGSGAFNDSGAVLSGVWSPDHAVDATIYSNASGVDEYQEVEIILRGNITTKNYLCYSISWNLNAANAYHEVSQFTGPFGGFVTNSHTFPGLASTGTVLRAQIKGNIITTYMNGVLKSTADITTFGAAISTGFPGIGFFRQGSTVTNLDFGFSHIVVSEI